MAWVSPAVDAVSFPCLNPCAEVVVESQMQRQSPRTHTDQLVNHTGLEPMYRVCSSLKIPLSPRESADAIFLVSLKVLILETQKSCSLSSMPTTMVLCRHTCTQPSLVVRNPAHNGLSFNRPSVRPSRPARPSPFVCGGEGRS